MPDMSITSVALVTPLYFAAESNLGGGERYPLNLAKALVGASPSDVKVRIVSFGPEYSRHSFTDRLEMTVLPVVADNGTPLDNISAEICSCLDEVDLVHVHQAFTRSGQVAILVAKFLGATLCATDHGARTNNLDKFTDYLQLVDLFVFYSNFAATMIKSQRPRTIIPGGVDTSWFTRPVVPRERTHVLFVGRLLPHKGVDRLIEAVPANLPLVVCGRPTNSEFSKHLVAIARGRNVEFVYDASDEDIRALYQSAIVTVLPSVHVDTWHNVYLYPELMGLTALESMACGTPAVVSQAGALPEFVEDGRTGYVFDSFAELGLICERIAHTPSMAEDMGREAALVVEERYSLPVVGEALWRSYCELQP